MKTATATVCTMPLSLMAFLQWTMASVERVRQRAVSARYSPSILTLQMLLSASYVVCCLYKARAEGVSSRARRIGYR